MKGELMSSVEEKLGEPIATIMAQYCGVGSGEFITAAGSGGDGVLPGNPTQSSPPHSPLFTFHAAGREDVDVRMLGSGRPFVIELTASRPVLVPLAEFRRMQQGICAGEAVKALELAPATRSHLVVLAEGSEGKRKSYAALVWSSVPLTGHGHLAQKLSSMAQTPMRISQQTPVRVLHRRSLMTRSRMIRSGEGLLLSPHFFILHMVTSAGTYVKEFVHGDLGRTRPCLADVMGFGEDGDCDILFLDVVGHQESGGCVEGDGLGDEEEEGEEEED